MSSRITVFLALAASLLLSGCFFSEAPKFPADSAVAIFGDGGRFQAYERTDGDNYKKDEVVEIKRRTDGGYDFVNEKGEVQPISFHRIGDGLFVGQAREQGKPIYGYVVFRVAGNEAFVYLPDCIKQDKALLDKFGVAPRGQFECAIDGVSDPGAFFAAVKITEPTSKIVRE